MTNDQIQEFANFLHSRFCTNNHVDECAYFYATDDEWTKVVKDYCKGVWFDAAREVSDRLDIIRSKTYGA